MRRCSEELVQGLHYEEAAESKDDHIFHLWKQFHRFAGSAVVESLAGLVIFEDGVSALQRSGVTETSSTGGWPTTGRGCGDDPSASS